MSLKHKRIKTFRILLVCFVFFLIALGVFLFWFEFKSNRQQKHNPYKFSKKEISLLQDGDILLRQGFGIVSKSISSMLSEEFSISHCAILRKTQNDSLYVIHSVSSSLSDFDGVQSCSLKKFTKESVPRSIIVLRFNKDSIYNNSKIAERAEYYLSKQVPFDNDFNLDDDSEMYCSELIWKVIKDEYDIDIFDLANNNNKKEKNHNFSVFWNTPYFEIILNHQEEK